MKERSTLTMSRVLITTTRTVLGYVVFVTFLFSVPMYNHFKTILIEMADMHSEIKTVIGETLVIIEVADDEVERDRGLSGRDKLEPNRGMMFVFDQLDFHGIWMKDMKFPIDIIWLDDTQQVVTIKTYISPDSYPEVFRPTQESLYVLEVPAGFVKTAEIKIGDQLVVF